MSDDLSEESIESIVADDTTALEMHISNARNALDFALCKPDAMRVHIQLTNAWCELEAAIQNITGLEK